MIILDNHRCCYFNDAVKNVLLYIVPVMKRRKFVQNLSASILLLMSNGMVTPAKAADIRKKSLLRFAITSDGHYGEKNTPFEKNFSAIIKALNNFHSANPVDFCVFNGDIFHNDPAFLQPAAEAIQQCRIPVYVTKGNHDMVNIETWKQTWNMDVNHDVVLGDHVLLLGATADEKGKYICPDLDWFADKLKEYRDARNVFIFLHITPVKWTTHAIDCPLFQKLLLSAKNVRAVFNGHDHDQDGIKFLGNIPFLFDGHFGGSWGTAYQGFRVVELQEDNSLLTYMMDPLKKLAELNIYRQDGVLE